MGLIADPCDKDYRPITLEAHDLVFGDRQGSYGHPLDDFTCTAAMWTAYLQHKGIIPPGEAIQAEDVGLMMVCVKLSRQANAPKRDNCVDGAGYFETTERVIHERARRARVDEEFVSSIADLKMARELDLRESDLKFPPDGVINCDSAKSPTYYPTESVRHTSWTERSIAARLQAAEAGDKL